MVSRRSFLIASACATAGVLASRGLSAAMPRRRPEINLVLVSANPGGLTWYQCGCVEMEPETWLQRGDRLGRFWGMSPSVVAMLKAECAVAIELRRQYAAMDPPSPTLTPVPHWCMRTRGARGRPGDMQELIDVMHKLGIAEL